MKTLEHLSNAQIAEILMNGQNIKATEIDSEYVAPSNPDVKSRIVYKDKAMTIYYWVTPMPNVGTLEKFFIYSTWWGKIKQSKITLQGYQGKSEKRGATFSIHDLKIPKSIPQTNANNKNMAVPIASTNKSFADFVAHCQRVYRASPSYEVSRVLRLSPNSWVEVQITLPNGEVHYSEGTNKKEAANAFAQQYNW